MTGMVILKYMLIVVFAGLAIAWAAQVISAVCARRRSARNRRFADARFTPRQEEVEQRYAEYKSPTYLRTRAEDQRLMPTVLRRQAGDR